MIGDLKELLKASREYNSEMKGSRNVVADENLRECTECGRPCPSGELVGGVCPDCREVLEECIGCGQLCHRDDLVDGFCPDCIEDEIECDVFYDEGAATDEDDWEAENL